MMISCHHHNCHHYGYHHCNHHSQLIISTELCLLMMINMAISIVIYHHCHSYDHYHCCHHQPNYASAFLFGDDQGHHGYHQSSKSIFKSPAIGLQSVQTGPRYQTL